MTEAKSGKRLKRKPLLIAGVAFAIIALAALWLYNTYEVLKIRPPAPLTEDVSLERPPSTFNMPITIELSVLEAYLNGKIRGDFLETNFWLQEKKKEKVALTLTRNMPILIRSKGRELICRFPLSIDAELIDSRLGKSLTKLLVRPVSARAVVTLSTPVTIERNWHLVTKFRIINVEWLDEPVVKIGPFRKNLTETINTFISDNSSGLTALLDRELNKAANLKPTISEVWLDLQEPILVVRKPAQMWIRFNCSDVDGRISLQGNRIICMTRIQATMRMLTDTTSMRSANVLPPFRQIRKEKAQTLSYINFFAFVPFDEINAQLNHYFKGRTFTKEGYHIAVKGIRAYASQRGLSIAVMTDHDLKGNVVMSGRMYYDVPTHSLRIDKFDYAVDTGNPVISTGDLIMHNVVRDSLASKLDMQFDTLIQKLPTVITHAVAKAKAGKTIDLSVDSLNVHDCQIRMGKNNVYLLVNATARTGLRLKRIKPGKALRIIKEERHEKEEKR
jgi:hypothetical protein